MTSLYKITITKVVDNPNYNEEAYKKWDERRRDRYGYSNPEEGYDPNTMRKVNEVVALQCDLPPEAFDAIRKAVIEKL